MYNKYDPLWDKGRCYHPAAIHALTDRCEVLQSLGVEQAAGMAALGKTYYEMCQAKRSEMGDSPLCGLASRVNALNAFVEGEENRRLIKERAIARGKERRPVELTPDQEIIAQIMDEETEDVYHTLSLTSGLPPHLIRQKPGSCMQGAYLLQQRLRRRGIESAIQRYTKPPFFAHFTIVTQVPGLKEQLRGDNTWQQMMPEGTDYEPLPHTLITPVSRTAEAVANLGVEDCWAGVWEESKPCSVGWWEYNSKSLNDILAFEGWYEQAEPLPVELARELRSARSAHQTGDPVLDGINQIITTLPETQDGR